MAEEGSKKKGAPPREGEGRHVDAESPLQRALRKAAEEAAARKAEAGRSERPTLTGMPAVRPPAKPLSPEITLPGMPVVGFGKPGARPRRGGGYAEPEELSPEEQRVIRERLKDNPGLASAFLDRKNANTARMLLEKIKEETRYVKELEERGFPRGLPNPLPFAAALGPVSGGKPDFMSRLNLLKQLASAMRVFSQRFGEPTPAFKALPERRREEVLKAALKAFQEHEELREELHGKGFDKNLPVTHGLSEALDAKPTPLADHFPELDRHLQTLQQLRKLGGNEIASYARYAERIAGRRE
ncbi:MAG: hypothetical protein AB1626_04250 [Candidatus Micrarchaeota archaeon]